MSSIAQPDLAGLALLARNGDRELRPVLLTLHTREFVSSAGRDRRTISTFEALALGLIPLVPDDVIADISAMLRHVTEAPPRVMELLAERRRAVSLPDPVRDARSGALTRSKIADLLVHGNRKIDLALAENPDAALDAHARHVLVGRALGDGGLAQALLRRSDLAVSERSALFRFAQEAADRDRLRDDIERMSAVGAAPLPHLSDWRRTRLMRAAAKADLPGLLAELGRALGLTPPPSWRLDHEVEAELFAMSLVAVGLTVEDCVRVLLTADCRIAASVPAVFRLRQVCRTTSRTVACQILGAGPKPRAARARRSGEPRAKKADGARALSATQPARATRARPASAPADRRSRSTTGPDRS